MSLPPSLITVMTPFPYSVHPEAPVVDAVDLMNEHDVHHLPVVSDNTVVGLLTTLDIALAQARGGPDADLCVGDCCEPDVYVVDLHEPLDNVLLTMADRRTDCAVVTRHGNLAGVFTAVDACTAFGKYLSENFPHGDDGEAA